MAQTLDDFVADFALFDDWEGRFAYLIDLGKALPDLDDSYKTDEFLVRGCTSKVWLVADREGDKLIFKADSDAFIVKGLIALLLAAYSGKTAQEILATDIEAAFTEMGLETHLSPNRRNGFFAMVKKMRDYAQSLAA
ncbi:MAG: SufE family protein [Pseudobdellovibrionaceae bacterium]